MATPGLDRLEHLLKSGDFLFHGASAHTNRRCLYPACERVNLDPASLRGLFVPSVGMFAPAPLVRRVFASPLAAALIQVVQAEDGSVPLHADEFGDGTIALTLGENRSNLGCLRKLMAEIASQEDRTPIARRDICVLRRRDFARETPLYLFPGQHWATGPVEVVELVTLTAGDVRWLAAFLEHGPLPLEQASTVQARPFEEIYSNGGHLHFEPHSGQRLPRRIPNDADRRIALELAKARAGRWLEERRDQAAPGIIAPLPEYHPPGGEARFQTRALRRAVRFIEQGCDRNLSVGEIAASAGVSKTHLHRIFRETLGCSPLEYAAEKRLDLAERLLRETELSIGEVSARCGFSEQASLSRSLRRRRGVTPTALRRWALLDESEPPSQMEGSRVKTADPRC